MNRYTKLATCLIAVGLASSAAAAQAAATLPQVETAGAISYMSGGIGKGEALAMKKAERAYPLSMVFSAGEHNEYVADIGVTIRNHADKVVLRTNSDGPIMLVKLPPGAYKISAEMSGKTLQRSAKVAAKGDTNLSFHWRHA
jgi:hypothetical protein